MIGAPPLRVHHPSLAIVGGIQPGRLQTLGFDAGDGLVERFLFSYPAPLPIPSWSEQGVTEATQHGWRTVVDRLWRQPSALKDGRDVPRVLYFANKSNLPNIPNPSPKERWVEHYRQLVEEMNSEEFNPALRGLFGKLREYAGRLTLVVSLLWQASRGEPPYGGDISTEDVEHAWTLLGYFKNSALRVFAEATGGGMDADARAVLDWIKRHRPTSFRSAEVSEHVRRFTGSSAST